MRWDQFRRSTNVEETSGGGTGPGGFRIRGGHLGIGAVVLILLGSWALGIDPSAVIGALEGNPGSYTQAPDTQTASVSQTSGNSEHQFVAAILGETEDRWTEILGERGVTYAPPKLVLFSGITRSGCGAALSAMGPFYCPNDERIYLDTEFFHEMETRLGACPPSTRTCEFSEAYVIAHEVGHHVQNLLGILPRASQLQRQADESQSNRIQVRLELQADCFAGLWAARAEAKWHFLETGDVDTALQTASAIGDDTLQRRSQGYAVPDSFTHGTSAQRKRWFMNGLKGQSIESCDTLSATEL
jgi:predicted metalloprotease